MSVKCRDDDNNNNKGKSHAACATDATRGNLAVLLVKVVGVEKADLVFAELAAGRLGYATRSYKGCVILKLAEIALMPLHAVPTQRHISTTTQK